MDNVVLNIITKKLGKNYPLYSVDFRELFHISVLSVIGQSYNDPSSR